MLSSFVKFKPDDSNLLHFSESVNKLNKYNNLDMKNLTDWLNANKISCHFFKKTELLIFKHKKKKLECPVSINFSRKRPDPSNSVKCLGVKIDKNLNCKDHIHDIATKLNKANALLYKIRNYPNFNTLKSIYFVIFDSVTLTPHLEFSPYKKKSFTWVYFKNSY